MATPQHSSMMMPNRIEQTLNVAVEDSQIRVQAVVLDTKGLDKLIAILEQNRQFLAVHPQAIGT